MYKMCPGRIVKKQNLKTHSRLKFLDTNVAIKNKI